MASEPKTHLHNWDDTTGWMSVCGIRTSSIHDHPDEEVIDCKRCLKIMERHELNAYDTSDI